jgi:hypothetical protein
MRDDREQAASDRRFADRRLWHASFALPVQTNGWQEARNMNSWETLKQFGSSLHLHRLAAGAAMLTCIAVALNAGPFEKLSKLDWSIRNARDGKARILVEPNGASSISVPDLQRHTSFEGPQFAVKAAGISEPVAFAAGTVSKSSPELSPVLVAEIASPDSKAGPPEHGRLELESKASFDELGLTGSAKLRQPEDGNFDLAKSAAIPGVWAPNAGTCSARDFREGALPTVISADGAWAGETFCMFSNKKQTETGWSVVAKCSSPRERWTANVRLTVKDNHLTWTSKRGSQVYSRCAPDVLMAEAR